MGSIEKSWEKTPAPLWQWGSEEIHVGRAVNMLLTVPSRKWRQNVEDLGSKNGSVDAVPERDEDEEEEKHYDVKMKNSKILWITMAPPQLRDGRWSSRVGHAAAPAPRGFCPLGELEAKRVSFSGSASDWNGSDQTNPD